MNRKKIALYVEGQTEQILVNQLIKTWWSYSGIEIINIKTSTSSECKVVDYQGVGNEELFFLIVDVDGEGSLISSIANRANKQREEGYTIIGLRDLLASDFKKLSPIHKEKTAETLLENFQHAFKTLKCTRPEKIEIFFSIMAIETWLLAFSNALSKWGKKSAFDIPSNLETIQDPSNWIKKIGKDANRGDPKSFHEVTSYVNSITREDIIDVYKSNRIPSFTKFWNKILSIEE